MRTRSLACALAVVFVLSASAGWAQENVTALLKSGERVTGELWDLGGYDYTFKVNGQERRIPIGDITVLDFSGNAENLPQAEASKAGEGRHLIVMKNGQVLEGKLLDIREGSKPLGLTVVINGEQRPLSSDEVARIYLDRPVPAATGTTGNQPGAPASGSGRTIQVSAQRQWTPTGIVVRRGEVIQFSSSGEVRLSADANDTSRVPGREGRRGANYTLASTLGGALIGRVGNGQPFGIGDQASVPMPAAGELFLGVNDDVFTDNSGEFTVTVTPQGGTAVPRRR